MADQHRDQVPLQLRAAGLPTAGVDEAVQVAGALVQLDQQRHYRRERQHVGQLRLQRRGLGRDVLRGQRRDHQIAGFVQANRTIPAGQDLLQLAERLGQLVLRCGQRTGGIGELAHELAELHPLQHPLVRGQQVGGRVAVAARARHEHVTSAQPVP